MLDSKTQDNKIVEKTEEIMNILKGLTLIEFNAIIRKLQNRVANTTKIPY